MMYFVVWQARILCNNTSSNRVCGDKDWQLRHVRLQDYKQQSLSECAAVDPLKSVVLFLIYCGPDHKYSLIKVTNIPLQMCTHA